MPHLLAAATIRGRHLFRSRASDIVRLLFKGSVYSKKYGISASFFPSEVAYGTSVQLASRPWHPCSQPLTSSLSKCHKQCLVLPQSSTTLTVRMYLDALYQAHKILIKKSIKTAVFKCKKSYHNRKCLSCEITSTEVLFNHSPSQI